MTSLSKLFLAHPSSVDETYGEHAAFAFGFSVQLFAAAFAALIHSVLPFAFEKTAGNKIRALYQRIHNRG